MDRTIEHEIVDAMPDRMPTKIETARQIGDLPVARPPARRLVSTALLDGASEVVIEHGVEQYRLRLTSKGKLILTK